MILCSELENNMIRLFILFAYGIAQIIGSSVNSMENAINSIERKDKSDQQLWENFKRDYNKAYQSMNENNMRRDIFINNLKTIRHHNNRTNNSFRMGINQYGDFTFEDIRKHNSIDEDEFYSTASFDDFVMPETIMYGVENFNRTPPEHFDWREHGVIMAVRNQGFCGACYAFASLEGLESTIFIKTGKHIEFSRQEIVDCAVNHGTRGCNGGILHGVYSYINQKGGISLQKNYPFIMNESSQCAEHIARVKFQITKIAEFETEDEEILKKALYSEGPLIILIDNLNESFYRYSSGIYYEEKCCDEQRPPTHAVVLVGYGNEDGNDYWIIKNSYGDKWGESGYMRIARNKNNHCKIASFNMIPIIDERQFFQEYDQLNRK